jgi:hypothetical protein
MPGQHVGFASHQIGKYVFHAQTKKNKEWLRLIFIEFEDSKGVIRIRISKDRQHNDQKKKDKQRSTKHTDKTKDRETFFILGYHHAYHWNKESPWILISLRQCVWSSEN